MQKKRPRESGALVGDLPNEAEEAKLLGFGVVELHLEDVKIGIFLREVFVSQVVGRFSW